MTTAPAQDAPLRTGVRDPQRLRAVAEAELHGHLADPDLDAIVDTLRLACGAAIVAINVVSPDVQTYPAEIGVGAPCSFVPDELSFCAEVVQHGQLVSVGDAAGHPVYRDNPLVAAGTVRAYAGAPLVDDGVVLGAVSLFDDRPDAFTDRELQILRHQARLASSVLALRRSARTDALTGLPTRALLVDRLGRALARMHRHSGGTCVMFLDIDAFKTINDRHGHAAGDAVLVELAARLRRVLRPADTLARFGGDEFVVLCEDLADDGDAEAMASRLIAAMGEAWHVGGVRQVDISVGIAVTRDPGTDACTVLRHADEAMYDAKRRPGSTWALAGHSTTVDLRDDATSSWPSRSADTHG